MDLSFNLEIFAHLVHIVNIETTSYLQKEKHLLLHSVLQDIFTMGFNWRNFGVPIFLPAAITLDDDRRID